MTDFLFHKVSEKERDDIRKQAKSIMNSFSKKLEKVGKKMSEVLIERKEGEREEGRKPNEIDREIMFENAPNKNKDFIVGESKRW